MSAIEDIKSALPDLETEVNAQYAYFQDAIIISIPFTVVIPADAIIKAESLPTALAEGLKPLMGVMLKDLEVLDSFIDSYTIEKNSD